MDRKQSTVFELLKNEHFVQWVQHPTDDSNHYWTKWISNHEDLSNHVEIARRIIQCGSLKYSQPIPEEKYDTMLENVMNYARSKQNVKFISRLSFWKYAAVAASLTVIVISIFSLIFNQPQPSPLTDDSLVVKEAPFGSKLTTKLPDGSTVTLNSGSAISFPKTFQGHSFEVYLLGEAFFEVEHDPSKTFYVHFRDQTVKVLGTSFNIRTYDLENYSEVAVATGRVEYSLDTGNGIVLLPYEKASLKKGSLDFKKQQVNEWSDFGWRDHILYFESKSFEEIRIALERWYGVEIDHSEFKPEGTYTGKFDNPTLKEILTGLSFVYRFDFLIEESKVFISSQRETN